MEYVVDILTDGLDEVVYAGDDVIVAWSTYEATVIDAQNNRDGATVEQSFRLMADGDILAETTV